MTAVPFTDARNRLSELIDEVASTHERQLAESKAAVEAGDVLDADELAALMAKRSKQAR